MEKQIVTLLVGAVGALGAIILKEAVQAAMQRRTVAWQLFGQLWTMKAAMGRIPGIGAAFEKLREQEEDLMSAFREGAAEFKRRSSKHSDTRAELRELIRQKLIEHLADNKSLLSTNHDIRKASQQALARSRDYLADGKTFITDRDAASLGMKAALHVTRFRSSALACMYGLEVLQSIQIQDANDVSPDLMHLVASLVQNGEDMLVAMVHLDRICDATTSKSLVALVRETVVPH